MVVAGELAFLLLHSSVMFSASHLLFMPLGMMAILGCQPDSVQKKEPQLRNCLYHNWPVAKSGG